MSLADIYNIPSSDADMAKWSFVHMAHHRDINAAILARTGISLPEYVLDPVDLANPEQFLNLHQQMHNNNDAIPGVSGYDLSEVDWNNKEQLAGWIYLNATLHSAEANVLGVY